MSTIDKKTKKGNFFFDPEDPIYQDHFPGQPIIPGSLIIHAFIKAVGADRRRASPVSIVNFRFKRFVSPGYYAYLIEQKSDGRLACTLYDREKAVVTGTL